MSENTTKQNITYKISKCKKKKKNQHKLQRGTGIVSKKKHTLFPTKNSVHSYHLFLLYSPRKITNKKKRKNAQKKEMNEINTICVCASFGKK